MGFISQLITGGPTLYIVLKLTIHQQQSRNGWLDIQFNIILHYLILYSIYTPIFTCTIEKQNTFTLFYSITPVI